MVYNNMIKIKTTDKVTSVLTDEASDYCIQVPSYFPVEFNFNETIAAIIHVFYVDLMEEILVYIANIKVKVDLYISTNSDDKKKEIEKFLANYINGNVVVKVFENKGRDVAPTFIGFRDIFTRYKYFIHLHTKKSLTSSLGNEWRQYLLDTLVGSEDIVNTILWQLSQPQIGIVFAQHFDYVRDYLDWGDETFFLIQNLLSKSDINITQSNHLEFPSSTMFWGKTAAIRKLLDAGICFDDFSEEDNQVSNTLAHAIERAILFYVEDAGYQWIKIGRTDLLKNKKNVLACYDDNQFQRAMDRVFFSVFTLFSDELISYLSKKVSLLYAVIGELPVIKVYYAPNKEFSEKYSITQEIINKSNHYIFDFTNVENISFLRIDPINIPAEVELISLGLVLDSGQLISLEHIEWHNANEVIDNKFTFFHNDPMWIISCPELHKIKKLEINLSFQFKVNSLCISNNKNESYFQKYIDKIKLIKVIKGYLPT